MLNTIAAIAAGGALGAVMRHGANMVALKTFGPDFPWVTLFVNVLGSFLLGAFVGLFDHVWQPSQELRLFLVTGFLGAFTTFSTFSLNVWVLYENHAYLQMGFYILLSVALSILALIVALVLVRSFVS